MTRDLFGAEIHIPNIHKVIFMSAHFKCCSGTEEGERRNEEAAFVGAYCSNLNAKSESFVFCGDLNDDPSYPRPPSNVHGILTNAGADLVELHPRDDDGSDITYPDYRRNDFIIPVNHIAGIITTSYVFRTETMNNRPAWLALNDSAEASDHLLIYADINIIPEPLFLTFFIFSFLYLHVSRVSNEQMA